MVDYKTEDYKTAERIQSFLLMGGYATEDEIILVTQIYGYTEEVLNNIFLARTGYRNIEQMEE